MSFHTSYNHQENAASQPELSQIVLQQSQYLQRMHEELANRDQQFKILLAKVNDLQVQNTTTTSSNLLIKSTNANTKELALATPKKGKKQQLKPSQVPSTQKKAHPSRRAVSAPPPGPSPRRNPNQMIMSETPEGFKETKHPIQLCLKNLIRTFPEMNKFVIYVHASLARIGIRQWAPDLDDSSDTLYNEACRLSAIQTFRQVATIGAYQYMNINLRFLNDIGLLEAAYNHYVHWLMAQRYKKETRENAKHRKDELKKIIFKCRQRLRDTRYQFGVSQKFPKRYMKILEALDAHSDDEYHPVRKVYLIKTLKFRSNKATKFMRRVDEEIEKTDNANGKRTQRRQRVEPQSPMESLCKRVPKGLPLDFYDPEWFNECPSGERTVTADSHNVAFLQDVSKSIRGRQHPDEKLNDRNFTDKYWDEMTEPYDLSHEIAAEEEDDSDESDSTDLDGTSEELNKSDEEGNDSDWENLDNQAIQGKVEDRDTEMAHVEDPGCFAVGVNSGFSGVENAWANW
ncbi:hypothetical protein O181_057652 [Austropuccinia psidii MF-1]|uniref:Uncharacterized protein n=1 Tax=Austropuccinia psidii MF-1 TaxID=1389203 RepID=A0A9Q3EI76_9BASI|nr:hypothetical protein [Austropuccinia psidii MF-1]